MSDRKQKVRKKNVTSEWRNIVGGIQLAPSLAPFFCLVYIKDLPNVCLFSQDNVFADDTKLVASICTEEELYNDLANVDKWLRANNISLHWKTPTNKCLKE